MTQWQFSENQLFEKVAAFTDIHYGRRGNERQANQDNSDFLDWFIAEAEKFGADIVVCLGDWHDNRNSLNVSTMNYSLSDMEKLAGKFKQFILINGNHDLMYRDKRDLNSVEFGRNIKNLTIVKTPMTLGGVSFLPWLVGDEWKAVRENKSKYIFGHFELPFFLMNGKIEMQDHGGLSEKEFVNQDYVFSGHFHKRQARGKVVYIGNPYPFDYSDAWDDDRGAMFMEWGKEPTFKEWDAAPSFKTMKLSDLLATPHELIKPKTNIKASIDIDISYEEAQFVKTVLTTHYSARKIELIPINSNVDIDEYDDTVVFQSVDQIVEAGINSMESAGIDNKMLIEMYRSLKS